MRVYIINANWGHGGPGSIAEDLYNTLIQQGHCCRFAYARGKTPEDVNSFRVGTKADVYSHVLIARLFDNAGFLSTSATKKLIDDINEFAPDIISIQNPLGYSLNVELLLQFVRKSKIPSFWTLHDCWLFTGHCTTELCEKLSGGCGNCPHKSDFPKSILFDNSKKNLQRKRDKFSNISSLHLVAPSQWIATLARQSYLSQYDITVINNGIDLTVFKPTESNIREKYSIDNSKKLLLAVANVWDARKGSKYIYMIDKMLDDSYSIVLIGRNEDEELKNNKRIIHIQQTEDRQQLVQWYSAADLLINPTMGDNFPTVILESIACGTPVVSFDTGGCKEAIGTCGDVVPKGDVRSMVQEIEACLDRRITKDVCVEYARKYDKHDRYIDYINLFAKYIAPKKQI